jgi:hypothetical protein
MFMQTLAKWWIAGNLGAIAAWIYVASRIWPWPPYEHCDCAPGDPWYFFLLVLPPLAVATIIQIAALITSIIRGRRTRRWALLTAVLVTTGAWIGAAAIDCQCAQRYVTEECPLK